jgi:hypothetical protein
MTPNDIGDSLMSRVFRHPQNRLLEGTLRGASEIGLDPVAKT